ncbi:Uncharacterized membrane protein YczE [Alkalibacterium putridalgicola]|jgi:uncharacterized membrane protein YczE|uniref:Membrane protein n=1 Tax=Alkalibacterium putridalgicola TaxID=426703 RepID=A0A1H7QH18_9LACT|nr:hypothetical protein [Alkalibacterium putridalgicola]GEK88467.1 membrane protein [Alkalibacterium putridalgicola]SEL47400.1 Uncharacterized membrane protein YczE [Alkalibacterium putridalgicola]
MKKTKITYSLIGTIFIALAVTTFRLASLGTDPYTTFNLGFTILLNMEYGLFLMYSGLLMLIYVFFANRALIGIGTIFNIFIVGNLSDVFVELIVTNFGTLENLPIRLFISALGILFLSMGAALYIEAKEGVAPYDAMPIILAEKAGLSYRLSRVIIDVSLTAIGFFLGASLGINTVITAFFLGPFIQFFRDIFKKDLDTRELKYSSKK